WCGAPAVPAPSLNSVVPSEASVISVASLEAIMLSPSRLDLRRTPAFAGDLLDRAQAVVYGFRQRRRLGGQIDQRPRHQEHHHQVKDRGEAQRECEALHLA